MSESERRRKYRYNRVLIETARVLSSTLDDAVVFLSGAQLEMLRNVTQYLRRPESYVSEYNPGYYLTPTIANYDDILAIVADLEETLMGNPNTIWGYDDRLEETKSHAKSGNGTHHMSVFTVPAGYVYVVNASMSRNNTTIVNQWHRLYTGADYYEIKTVDAQPANEWFINDNVYYPLKAGDQLMATFFDCLDGDILYGRAWGYKMVVPG